MRTLNRPGTLIERSAAPRRSLGFIAASTSLVTAFAVSASPIPLFNGYRSTAGLTNADLSLTVVVYFVGTLGALLCLGRISDHVGRRPASLAVLLTLVAGALVMLHVTSVVPLLAGRFLMGIGCGLASSTLMAYATDTAPRHPEWLGSVVVSQSPLIGLTVGSLASGVLVESTSTAPVTVYLVMVCALAACVVLLLAAPETSPRAPGAWGSMRPRVRVTAQARPLMPVAVCVFGATWSLGGFYQAFSPSITADRLHTHDAVVVALVFGSYLAPSVLGGLVVARFDALRAQRVAMIGFAAAVVGLVVALVSGSVVAFIGVSLLAGALQGAAMSATVRALMAGARASERASQLAAIYLSSYAGAMVASLVAGQLSRVVSLVQLSIGYAVLAILAATATVVGRTDSYSAAAA